jgi:multimeric flavodoxin WrbA
MSGIAAAGLRGAIPGLEQSRVLMETRVRITAIVGSYRKGGVIDQAVDEMLAAAREEGAETTKIYLAEIRIEFCTNCRLCAQQDGASRGVCPIADQMGDVLDLVEASDSIILASPTNFATVTALMKRFIERLVCYAYWPWGKPAPKVRHRELPRRAVLVASSAAPAFLARLATSMVKLLKQAAGLLGARTVGVLFIGLAASEELPNLTERARRKARLLGKKLATGT